MDNIYNYKNLIAELLGVCIAIVWICFGILGAGNLVFLVVAISLTILLGVISGGLIAVSEKNVDHKEVIGWVLGAAIAVVWISFGILGAGDMVFLVVALSLTILLGVLSGGLISLSAKTKGS
ncbi:MAG: hypothetical protein ACFFAS_12075 [Promethearchaeota archaeon]